MLKLASRLQRISYQQVFARNYSEGFDISKYLDRIQAISKTNVNTTRRPQNASLTANKRGPSKHTTNTSATAAFAKNARPRTINPAKKTTNTNDSTSSRTTKTGAPNGSNNITNKSRTHLQKSQVNAAETSRPKQADSSEWSTLNDPVSKPLPRSGRRNLPKRPGFRVNAAKSKSAAAKKLNKPSTNRTNPEPRAYKPFLTPQQALDIVMRNEGTSYGGFIAPPDVSLSSLQPNFVVSAVSYNSRVRSLLNVVPSNAAQDQQKLEKLVNQYVSGGFEDHVLDSGKSLCDQGLAFEIGANRSVSPEQKQFFAQVGTGKLSPKQISSRL